MVVATTTFTAALSFLLAAPLLVAWAFALFDIARRRDLGRELKILYAVVLILVIPTTLLYLFARPTLIVGHRSRLSRPTSGIDWRSKLLAQLEAKPGSPPLMSNSEHREIVARMDSLAGAANGAVNGTTSSGG